MRLLFILLLFSFSGSAQKTHIERPKVNLIVGDSTVQKSIEIPICVTPDTLVIAPTYKAHVLGFHIVEFIVDDEKGEKTYFATYDFNWDKIHCYLITDNSDFIQEKYFFYSAIEIKVESIYYYNQLDPYGMPMPLEVSQRTMKSIEITHSGHFRLIKTEQLNR